MVMRKAKVPIKQAKAVPKKAQRVLQTGVTINANPIAVEAYNDAHTGDIDTEAGRIVIRSKSQSLIVFCDPDGHLMVRWESTGT